MGRLYTYIIKIDSGLAPNPFWGWCTLAVCTPNHQGSAIKPGDWIAGFSTKDKGYQFIYAMEVSEKIRMEVYFHDPRFQEKKPRMDGNWMQRCGDNIYDLVGEDWIALHNPYHEGLEKQDTRCPFVFIGSRFWYLGSKRVTTPLEFLSMVGGRGARVNHPFELTEKFKVWVQSNFNEGINAMPLDAALSTGCSPCATNCNTTCVPHSCIGTKENCAATAIYEKHPCDRH